MHRGSLWAWSSLLALAGLGIFVPANNSVIMRGTAGSSASLLGGLVNMARGIGTTLGISLVALALHLGNPGNFPHASHGYAESAQARPASIVLAVVSAAAATIALAGRAQPRGSRVPGRWGCQVSEGYRAQDQLDQDEPADAHDRDQRNQDRDQRNQDRDQVSPDRVGPELADIVSRLRRAMRRAARAADPALGLSVAQLELLSCIAEHPGIRPSQLARMLRLAPSSVATLLNGLQTTGFVVRADGAGDRRTVSLHLSPEGAAAVTRWHRVNENIIQAALVMLSERDRAALRDAAPALRDLTSSIDALAD